jgi:acyl-CoA thioesterase II
MARHLQVKSSSCSTVGHPETDSKGDTQGVTGWFILEGLLDVPFIYKVHNIRDGRSYCTRIVNVTQATGKGTCFTCTCSFKTDETSTLDTQRSMDLWQTYSSVLKDKTPEDFPEAPGMDVPWYWKELEQGHPNDKFPGLKTLKANMKAFNEPRQPLDRRQLIFYKTIGDMPDDANLHMCAHLYASDRNSLFIVANHLEVGDAWTQMGSLAHTVNFLAPVKDLLFKAARENTPGNPQGDWFCSEDWTERASVGRGILHSRGWSPDGTHVMTVMQDGMIRVGEPPKAKGVVRGRL